jgi:hypothetical protein
MEDRVRLLPLGLLEKVWSVVGRNGAGLERLQAHCYETTSMLKDRRLIGHPLDTRSFTEADGMISPE